MSLKTSREICTWRANGTKIEKAIQRKNWEKKERKIKSRVRAVLKIEYYVKAVQSILRNNWWKNGVISSKQTLNKITTQKMKRSKAHQNQNICIICSFDMCTSRIYYLSIISFRLKLRRILRINMHMRSYSLVKYAEKNQVHINIYP